MATTRLSLSATPTFEYGEFLPKSAFNEQNGLVFRGLSGNSFSANFNASSGKALGFNSKSKSPIVVN